MANGIHKKGIKTVFFVIYNNNSCTSSSKRLGHFENTHLNYRPANKVLLCFEYDFALVIFDHQCVAMLNFFVQKGQIS